MMSPVRTGIAALVLWLGGVAVNGSASTALTVFDDYKDSPDSTYLFLAGLWLVFAAALIAIGALLLLRGTTRSGRGRPASIVAMLVISGASLPAALSFGYELGDIANDPTTESGNALGATASLAIGLFALAGAAWQLLRGGARKAPGLRIAAIAAAVAVFGVACVYLLVPPADEERLAGAAALVANRAVGCTEQDGGWFYCQAPGAPGREAKDYVVTFDGECWVTRAPRYRGNEITRLKEIHSGCMKRRGVGRTHPGPGESPPALADAAARLKAAPGQTPSGR